MLKTGEAVGQDLPPDLKEISKRIEQKSAKVFSTFPEAIDQSLAIMESAESLSDYYRKLEALLDSYMEKSTMT